MENPEKEISGIIAAMVQNDDLKLLERTIREYFAESAVLDHPVVFCRNRAEILELYEIWAMSNYSARCVVHEVWYHADADTLAVRLTQFVRKWFNPWIGERVMPMMVFFKLEDVPGDSGAGQEPGEPSRPRKRIVFQQDHHARSPFMVNMPFLEMISYGDFGLRPLTTWVLCWTDRAIKRVVDPTTFVHVIKGFYQVLGVE